MASESRNEDGHNNNNKNDNDSSSSSKISSAIWQGLGLFGESYILFSVGTLRPLWEMLYPACFDVDDPSQCRHPNLSYRSMTYGVVLGIMTGMIVLGSLANSIGRRVGSIITASLMATGASCLVLASALLSDDPSTLFPALGACLFVFGIGVGGEYPMSASIASERAMASARDRRRRRAMTGGELSDRAHRMRRLLAVTAVDGGAEDAVLTPRRDNASSSMTPRRDNVSATMKSNESKRESLLGANSHCGGGTATTTTMTRPWQTLKKTTKSSNGDNGGRGDGTAAVVEEGYCEGGGSRGSVIPLSPTNITNETCDSLSTQDPIPRTRGRDVLMVFSMQGMGIFVNSLMLSILLAATRSNNNNAKGANDDDEYRNDDDEYYYDPTTLLNIWRTTYAVGAAVLIYVLVSRIAYQAESEVWAQDRDRREEERRERQCRTAQATVGFDPPSVLGGNEDVGPYERHMRKEEAEGGKRRTMEEDIEGRRKREQQQQELPVISATVSSLTMKSEFDLLGSTNLDGCKIVPAIMMMDAVDDDDENEEDVDDHATRRRWRKRRNRMMTMVRPSSEVVLLFRHYGVRLFGTSVTWLLWDIAYYGNKLFQSSFLIALTGEDATLLDITRASAINAFVALLGYYAAAAIVDDPDCGRLALQQTGFAITGSLFLLCGCLNDRLSSTWLVVMYFGSSFFGQCGPNCTTYLIPAEVFPTSMRAMCHGISACAGKLGALVASILFNLVGGERDLFLISGYASFAASLITFLTIPETTSLDLHEIDKQWHAVLRDERYEGPATDPQYLSFYERNQNRLCRR